MSFIKCHRHGHCGYHEFYANELCEDSSIFPFTHFRKSQCVGEYTYIQENSHSQFYLYYFCFLAELRLFLGLEVLVTKVKTKSKNICFDVKLSKQRITCVDKLHRHKIISRTCL